MTMSYRELRERGERWHNSEHIPAIHGIAIEEIEKHDKELLDKFESLIDSVGDGIIGAITYDVKTVVKFSFADGKEIFESEKAREVVSRAIVDKFKDELKKNLRNITVK